MKGSLLFCVLVFLTTVGVFRIQLVAKEGEPTEAEAAVVGEELEQRIADF